MPNEVNFPSPMLKQHFDKRRQKFIVYEAVNNPDASIENFVDLPKIERAFAPHYNVDESTTHITEEYIHGLDHQIRYQYVADPNDFMLPHTLPFDPNGIKLRLKSEDQHPGLWKYCQTGRNLHFINHFKYNYGGCPVFTAMDNDGEIIAQYSIDRGNEHVIDGIQVELADTKFAFTSITPIQTVFYIAYDFDNRGDPKLPRNKYLFYTFDVEEGQTVKTPAVDNAIYAHVHTVKGAVGVGGYELTKQQFYEYDARESIDLIGHAAGTSLVIVAIKVDELDFSMFEVVE